MNFDHLANMAKMLSANFNAHEAALAALRKNLIPTSTLTAIADATASQCAQRLTASKDFSLLITFNGTLIPGTVLNACSCRNSWPCLLPLSMSCIP
jgi:hypothetical protein